MGDVVEFLRFASSAEHLRVGIAAEESKYSKVAQYIASPAWRKHVYAFSIVSIYGAHERFIKDFCAEAVVALGRIYENYLDLPEKVRLHHERLSVERAKDILEGRVGDRADFQQALSNLHACFDGSVSLNSDVFSASTSNYRSHTVRDVMARLAVDLPAIDQNAEIASIVSTELNGFYSSVSAVVDDLAKLRNEVAHGSDFNTLDLGTLGSILRVVCEYDYWMYKQVAGSLLRTLVLKRAIDLGSVKKTYASSSSGIRSIGSVGSLSERVKVGENLYLLSGGNLCQATVQSIQVNKVDLPFVEAGVGPFGFDFGVAIKDGARLRRLPARCTGLARMLTIALEEQPMVFEGIGAGIVNLNRAETPASELAAA